MRILTLAFVLLACIQVAAAEERQYSRVLLPIFGLPAPGAYGSTWVSETWMHYSGAEETEIFPRPFCYLIQCLLGGTLEPGWSAVPYRSLDGFPFGVLVHIEESAEKHIEFSSRVRDISRAADSAGTQVPAVRESQFSTGAVRLLDVPLNSNQRVSLRIYALPEHPEPVVEVRYLSQPEPGGVDLDTGIHVLRVDRIVLTRYEPVLGYALRPSAALLPDIGTLPELVGLKKVWLEVVPVSPGLRLWAMASITDNDTQQVTLVAPQAR